jgi:hypothetical protein
MTGITSLRMAKLNGRLDSVAYSRCQRQSRLASWLRAQAVPRRHPAGTKLNMDRLTQVNFTRLQAC